MSSRGFAATGKAAESKDEPLGMELRGELQTISHNRIMNTSEVSKAVTKCHFQMVIFFLSAFLYFEVLVFYLVCFVNIFVQMI